MFTFEISFFLKLLEDLEFRHEDLVLASLSQKQLKQYDESDYDECFGYTPLLGLGGAEKVENLKKVKLKEHILIITEFMGPVQ